MTKPILTLATNGDDWEGLYVDGVLHTQGHRVTLDELAAALGLKFTTIEVSADYLGDKVSELPEKLARIPKSAILS